MKFNEYRGPLKPKIDHMDGAGKIRKLEWETMSSSELNEQLEILFEYKEKDFGMNTKPVIKFIDLSILEIEQILRDKHGVNIDQSSILI